MSTQSYGKYKWVKNDLYLYDTPTGMSVVPDLSTPYLMFRIKFEDGNLSQDLYNHTRAKDNAIKFHQRLDNNPLQAAL